jgi:UDP-GlcNAc:undecaprenyl-phosphate GlcNAc-1-phosphate transferase
VSALDLTASLPSWSRPLAPGLGAFLVTVAVTPLVIRLARRMGWVAEPREDRWHERPTALMGGIAIYVAASAGWMLLPAGDPPWGLWGGGTLLFLSGLADDVNGLSPVAKVVAQVAGATVILVSGWELAPAWPVWLSVSLTYLWVIGITNAVNLLDNMDGLAAGIAGIAAVTVAVLAAVAGQWPAAAPALVLAGAAAGFLVYNFHPASVFMGDSGALFLGFSVSALALSEPRAAASGTAAVLAVPAALMAVPILDTTLVTVRRIVSGRPVTQGGRDHSSHRLVFLGLSESRAVVTLYGVAAAFSLLAVVLRLFNVYLTLAVAGLATVALAVFGAYLGSVEVAQADAGASRSGGHARARDGTDRVALRAVFENKREIAGLLADLVLVVASFVVAHYLRFESGLTGEHLTRMVNLLPAVVLVKIGTLYWFGAYRGLLRYAGSHEFLQVIKASTVASAVTVVGLVMLYRFEGFSRSVFIIDWLLASVALVTVRGAFRGLRSYFSTKRTGGRRVLLYGAGDAGSLALREIRQNPELNLEPIGFVDDDPSKRGRIVQGVPVVGGGERLPELCDRYEIDDVLITISSLGDDAKQRIVEQCRRSRAVCRDFHLDFDVAPAERRESRASG